MNGGGRHEDSDSDRDEPVRPGSSCGQQAGAREVPVRPQGLGSWSRATVTIGAAAAAAEPSAAAAPPRRCQKCGERDARVVVRQNEPLCDVCLEAGVVGRVRAATKGRGLLQEQDSVLLALSGGAASAALLHAALALQNRNPARPQRGQVSFRLRVSHVQAPGAGGAAAAASAAAIASAAGVPPEDFFVAPLHLVFAEAHAPLWPSEDASGAAAGEGQQQQRLDELLSAIRDPTAAEDVAVHLRQRLLRRLAASTGCNKLLLGDCASTIAARVIADAAKGRGFSLPADIQALDVRWGGAWQRQQQPESSAGANGTAAAAGQHSSSNGRSSKAGGSAPLVVLLPLREVSMKEAQALAEFQGLLPPPAPSAAAAASDGDDAGACKATGGHGGSVNALAHGFVEAMQANLPASIFTVLRTASHLTAFDFNEPAAAGPAAAAAAAVAAGARASGSRAVGSGGGGAGAVKAAAAAVAALSVDESSGGACDAQPPLRLCSICDAPLPSKATSATNGQPAAVEAVTGLDAAAKVADETGLCYSCDRYVLQPLAAREALGRAEARARLESLLPPPFAL